jgi:hypothetical protein
MVGGCLTSLLLCEGGLRAYQKVALGIPMGNDGYFWEDGATQTHLSNLLDRRLGWRPTEGYVSDDPGRREDGSTYPRHVTQRRHGFRRYGTGHGPRTFVIGDSFTEALEVSDDRTYYARLEREIPLNVYAIGSLDYGTLQEAMLLDEYFDEIKPDLVIWQFCYNDFMNNSFELAGAWKADNCDTAQRPYLIGDDVQLRLLGPAGRLRAWAQRTLRLYDFVADRLARATCETTDRLMNEILSQGAEHPGFRRSVEITDRLLGRVAARVGRTPVILFEACTTAAPFRPAIESLAKRHGMEFVPELPGAIDLAEQRGQKLLASDHVHWDEEAQAIVAQALAPHVRRALARP